jgi:hypothetical protein
MPLRMRISSLEESGGMRNAKRGDVIGKHDGMLASLLFYVEVLVSNLLFHSLYLHTAAFVSVPKIESCLLLARICPPSVRLIGAASTARAPDRDRRYSFSEASRTEPARCVEGAKGPTKRLFVFLRVVARISFLSTTAANKVLRLEMRRLRREHSLGGGDCQTRCVGE